MSLPTPAPAVWCEMPAQPGPFRFPLAHTALVLIDMQRDFVEPGGFGASLGNDVSRLQAIVPALQALLAVWRQAGGWVVHTREGHRPDLSDCPTAKRERGKPTLRIGDEGPMGRVLIQGEPGHSLIPELAPVAGECVLDKPGKGAFYATGLDETLKARGITHLIFAGVTTEVCVQTSMREANDRGYDCLLLEDGTESYFPAFKTAVLEMVRAQGAIVGWTGLSTDLAAALPPPGLALAQLDLPETHAALRPLFLAYEAALMANDTAALAEFFWDDERVTRYGIADRQWGATALAAWRSGVPAPDFTRRLEHLRVLGLGPDVAVVQVEFVRSDTTLRGFQTQVWARMAGLGWKITSAHVSMIGWEPGR